MAFKLLTMLALAGLYSMPGNADFRDPTRPAYPQPETLDNSQGSNNTLILSAIWISDRTRRATINGITGKEGQTITINPAPTPAIPNQAANGNIQDGLANKTMTPINADRPIEKNVLTPLLEIAGSNSNPVQTPTLADTAQHTHMTQHPNSNTLATASIQPPNASTSLNTIKIVSIRRNSVTIMQNGALKTLQLVQRPYKISPGTH